MLLLILRELLTRFCSDKKLQYRINILFMVGVSETTAENTGVENSVYAFVLSYNYWSLITGNKSSVMSN